MKMKGKYMEKLVGKYCKIVTKRPGEKRAVVITGLLENVNYHDGFLLIDSKKGLDNIKLNNVIAIRSV